MNTRMTIDQLEQMKTHELADLLANVVLLLKRMPNVACKQLVQQIPPSSEFLESPKVERVTIATASLTREELTKKKVPELKTLARELNVLFSTSTKKDELINKILAKAAGGHSEQRAIQDL